MFFKKEVEKKETEEQTKCADCGAFIDKINEVKVVMESFYFFSDDYFFLFYCGKCKKPYNQVKRFGPSRDIPNKYYATIEVDEQGNPLKIKK